MLDEERDYEPLLMDWRAPAAQPFYIATAASPEGMRRRRHLRTRRREVDRPSTTRCSTSTTPPRPAAAPG